MADTVRAACPKCQSELKIPAEYVGKSVKCKKCGGVFQAKAKPPAVAETAAATPLTARPRPQPAPPPAPVQPTPVPASGEAPYYSPPPAAPASGAYPYPTPVYTPPVYAPPVYAAPAYAPPQPDIFLPEPEIGAAHRYRRKKSGAGVVFAVLALVVMGASAAAAVLFKEKILASLNLGGPAAATAPTGGADSRAVVPATGFPRRMLVMSVSKYLYCNGLTNGQPAADKEKNGDRVTEVARRLAFDWRIPTDKENNQLYVVSDTTGRDARPMLKPVVMQSYERFFASCRPQDHAVVYFGGHATEKEGKAFLVPVDGDLDDPESLIPLEEFYAKLQECPARQKAVLWDVCRLNEADDTVRPGSEPMSEGLEKALLDAPAGTQVVLGCSAGQRAGEYRSTPRDTDARGNNDLADVNGSLLLSAFNYAGSRGKAKGAGKDAKPEEPIPVAAWADAAKERAADVAKKTGRPAPTIQVGGAPPEGAADLAAAGPPPERFAIPAAPKGLAPEKVQAVVALIELPPLRPSLAAAQDPIEGVVPFAEELMKSYLPDNVSMREMEDDREKYKIRLATSEALATVRKEWGAAAGDAEGGSKLRDRFEGESDDGVKKAIVKEQEAPASIILELEEKSRLLDEAMADLETEPSKYWQVSFLYAAAEVKSRLAFMHEYNLLLGGIRTDALPERDAKKGETGYQMVSSDKMKSKKDVKELAESAQELFGKIAEEHRGTPWAVFAKRAKSVALGLEWKPYAPNAGPMDEK